MSVFSIFIGTVSFIFSGFCVELIALSIRKGGIPNDVGVGLLWAFIAFLLAIPFALIAAIPWSLLVPIAAKLRIRHPAIYCIVGLAAGAVTLPLFSKVGLNSERTLTELIIEPGIRLSISGLMVGLTFWKLTGSQSVRVK